MTEYIDKEVAINALIDNFIFHSYVGEAAKKVIDKIPAADVVEVVHGEWWSAPIENKEAGHKVRWDDLNPDCPAESCYCSVCGDWLTASDEYPAKGRFCPNCGADMGRSNNDNTD